jgi:fatty acid desaturase
MEENKNMFESLLEKATDYGKTSYELARLKAVQKTAEVTSSLLPHSVVLVIFSFCMLFLSLGLAWWLGEILGKIYLGFLAVGALYALTSLIIHFLMHDWIKKSISDGIIKQLLNKD